MTEYPVKNGLGQDIVTGYDVDADPFVPRSPAGDYPVKNGAGQTIIAAAPALTKTWPTRPDGARVVSRYPVKDGLGNTILSTGGNPAAWASSPAPGGCRWDFVTFNGALVTRSGEPVVSLVRIN